LNVPGIAGLGRAAEEIYSDFDAKIERLYSLKKRLITGLTHALADIRINGLPDMDRDISELSEEELSEVIKQTAPHIVSVSVKGVRAEVLLHALEDKEIYVSAGSACASNHPQVSSTLKAIGVEKNLLDSTVRLSMCEFTTEQEIDDAVKAFSEIVPMLREFSRR
jgi:cysteine desulfurase